MYEVSQNVALKDAAVSMLSISNVLFLYSLNGCSRRITLRLLPRKNKGKGLRALATIGGVTTRYSLTVALMEI